MESFEPFLMTLAANYLLLCSCCGLPRAGRPGICPLLPHPSKSCDLKIAHKKGYLVPHSRCVFSLFISPLLSNLKNILKSTGGEKKTLCRPKSVSVLSELFQDGTIPGSPGENSSCCPCWQCHGEQLLASMLSDPLSPLSPPCLQCSSPST